MRTQVDFSNSSTKDDVMIINRRIAEVQGSSTLAITAKAKALKAEGKDVVNFAGGEPDFDTPDAIKKAAIEAIQNGFTKYTPSIGTSDLRNAIINKFKNDNALNYQLNQIVVSSGAKHSIYNTIMALVDDGEEVIIPTPYWVSYPEMVKMAGGTPIFLETDKVHRFKISAEQLSRSITPKTKLLILTSPSNPTGMVYTRSELEEIAKVCVEKDIFVLSDEIYEKLIYDIDYVSIASLNDEIYQRTITVNGVSKAYSMTGWRIGYSAANPEIQAAVKNIQDHSTSNPASISQVAALQALQEPNETVLRMRDIFRQRRDLMASLLDSIAGVDYVLPEGAFYLFCDFSKLGNSFDVAKSILEDVNVAMIPGEGFGAPGFMRLSFSTSNERIREGVKRIADWAKSNS